MFICCITTTTRSRAVDQILGVPGSKKFWVSWRMTKKWISKKHPKQSIISRKVGGREEHDSLVRPIIEERGGGTGVGWGLSSLHLARWWLTRINFNTLSQTTFMATKTVNVVIYIEDLLSKKSHDPLITWYSNSEFFYTIYWFKAV